MKAYLSVGEVSSLFGLNVQTLHYYVKSGILVPEKRDSKGYRQYRFDQIYQLASIRYLRKMGYSIEGVKTFLDSRHPEDTIPLLKGHSRELKRQVDQLLRMDGAVMRKINYVERKLQNLDISKMEIRFYPQRWYIPIGTENQLYLDDSFYFYPTIAFYEEKVKYFGAFVDLASDGFAVEKVRPEKEDVLNQPSSAEGNAPRLESIPEGYFLVGYHKGPYTLCLKRFREMRHAFPELHYTGKAINFNIVDQFVERDPENYITEVELPIIG